jgi:hypothetical protein
MNAISTKAVLPHPWWVFLNLCGAWSDKAATYGRGATRRRFGSSDAPSGACEASCKHGRGDRRNDRGTAGAMSHGQRMLQMREAYGVAETPDLRHMPPAGTATKGPIQRNLTAALALENAAYMLKTLFDP